MNLMMERKGLREVTLNLSYLPCYRMVLPTVLKRRHTLKGVKLMPVLKNIRGGQPEALKDFARIELPDIEV